MCKVYTENIHILYNFLCPPFIIAIAVHMNFRTFIHRNNVPSIHSIIMDRAIVSMIPIFLFSKPSCNHIRLLFRIYAYIHTYVRYNVTYVTYLVFMENSYKTLTVEEKHIFIERYINICGASISSLSAKFKCIVKHAFLLHIIKEGDYYYTYMYCIAKEHYNIYKCCKMFRLL